jgi:hypothetical protein
LAGDLATFIKTDSLRFCFFEKYAQQCKHRWTKRGQIDEAEHALKTVVDMIEKQGIFPLEFPAT